MTPALNAISGLLAAINIPLEQTLPWNIALTRPANAIGRQDTNTSKPNEGDNSGSDAPPKKFSFNITINAPRKP